MERIQRLVGAGEYDVTKHAVDEMADDNLDVVDVELSILKGRIAKTEKDDPRGTRYTVAR